MKKVLTLVFILNVFLTQAQVSIEWERNYGGSSQEEANCIKETNDGGYLVIGSTGSVDGDVGGTNGFSDFWILKINAFGGIEWEQNYGGNLSDGAYDFEKN